MKLSQHNEVLKVLAEIEMKVKKIYQIMGQGEDNLLNALDQPDSYDAKVSEIGDKGILEMILALPAIEDRTRDFCTGLLEGLAKYGKLTDKQQSALAKVYWHNFVKGA